MPRKKQLDKTEPQDLQQEHATVADATAARDIDALGAADAQATSPATTTSPQPPEAQHPQPNEAPATGEPQRWSNPYWAVFTCREKGFELGENRRFKQMVFTFADNPGPDVTAKLKEAGFVYRGAEKAWTTPATAASRELAVDLARELKGEERGSSL